MSYAWSPMRSKSEIIFRAEETDRKSLATGCCIKSNAPKRLARQQNLLPRKGKEGTYAMEWGGK